MATYEDFQNNRFFKLGGKLSDIMVLSGLFVLCSLPVLTAGASAAALYYGTVKCFRKGSERPAREFWHSFKDNLRQGVAFSLIYLVFCGLIAFDIAASYKGVAGVQLPEGYRMFAFLLILPVAFTLFYVFPYISRYSAPMGLVLRNSFLLSASHIDHLLILIFITAAALAGCVFFPPAALVLPGLGALLSSKLIEKDFAKAEQLAGISSPAAPQDDENDEASDGADDGADGADGGADDGDDSDDSE